MEKFPKGNEPFQIISRLCEEAGELAQATNHREGVGAKLERHGLPEKDKIAGEAIDTIQNVLALLIYYNILDEFNRKIDGILDWMDKEEKNSSNSRFSDRPHRRMRPTRDTHGAN